MKNTKEEKKYKITRINLPIYWGDEIKYWHYMVKDLKEAWRLENDLTAGNNNVQYWEIEL